MIGLEGVAHPWLLALVVAVVFAIEAAIWLGGEAMERRERNRR